MKTFISTLLTLCFSQIALADTTYVCTHGDSQRTIEVAYLGSGTAPCEVRYTKDGFTEVLWSAQVQEGYCDEKASDFVEKQRGWGWECGESMAAMHNSAASSEVPEWQRLE